MRGQKKSRGEILRIDRHWRVCTWHRGVGRIASFRRLRCCCLPELCNDLASYAQLLASDQRRPQLRTRSRPAPAICPTITYKHSIAIVEDSSADNQQVSLVWIHQSGSLNVCRSYGSLHVGTPRLPKVRPPSSRQGTVSKHFDDLVQVTPPRR